jgi:tRNA pseudouridine-54 N-methylase
MDDYSVVQIDKTANHVNIYAVYNSNPTKKVCIKFKRDEYNNKTPNEIITKIEDALSKLTTDETQNKSSEFDITMLNNCIANKQSSKSEE